MALRTSYLVAAALMIGATPVFAGPNCKCLANGHEFEQGQVACILGKLARCGMALNNSSWKIIAEMCPQSSLTPTPSLIARLQDKLPHSKPPAC